MIKILIIGSKGFIGSACLSLFKSNSLYEAYGADVVADYTDKSYFLIDPSNSNFINIFRQQKFDWCINCAGAASVPDSFKHSLRDYLLNVNLVVHLLNAIKEENPSCKFIQLSSAAVYGNPEFLPIAEDQGLSPLSPYGIHKKNAEELCKLYHDYFDLSTYVVRIFSAYGVGLKKQLFWDLYTRSLANTDILLFGTGKETRDFIYVTDIALAIESIIKNIQTDFEVINIAKGQSVNIETAAKLFLDELKFKNNLYFTNQTRTGDPRNWEAEISVLKSLGFSPKISFENGIKLYAKWLHEKK